MRSPRALGLTSLLVAIAAPAAAQPTPSAPHPRLFMSATDLAAYSADATTAGTPAARAIADCQSAIDNPADQMTRGGSDGNTWPYAAMSCAFAYRVTTDASFLTQALASWHAALDDDQTLGDHLGCTVGVATDWTSWDGSPPAPPVILTVTHDTGYPIRWYGPFLALTYDWLSGAPGVDATLLAQTRTCLTAWIDYYAAHGYHHDEAGANYGAGFVLAQALAGVAIGDDGGADGHLFTNAIATYRDVLIARGLANLATTGPAGPMVGGDWLEGWQYGPLSVLEYAIGARALSDQGASLPEMSDWIDSVIVRHIHGLTPTRDAQWTGGGDFDSTDVYPTPSLNVIHAVLVGPSSDQAAAYAAMLDVGGETAFPVYGAFAHRRTITAVDYRMTVPPPATWFLSRGSRAIYARTSWDASALWTVYSSPPSLVSDHQHFAASNFVLTRGADHLIVDSAQYGAPDTLETNALTCDSPQLEMHGDYARTQTPWSAAELAWARASDGGVVAARSDLAAAFIFSSSPSDIPYAERDWAFLPEGAIVAIDRVHTADATHAMHVRFHANTGGGGLTLAGNDATGTVGSSRLGIHTVLASGGTPSILAPDHLGDSSSCTSSYPAGDCNDARFAVDIYALDVPGPYASAVQVIETEAMSDAAATIGSINNAPYADASGNAEVMGAAVFAGMHQSYVLASSAHDGAAGASIAYSVPATSASRHVVFDAAEASDGTSSVVASAAGGRCTITITAGSGGGFVGHPLMFAIDTACVATDGTDVPPGMPPMGGADAGPRTDAGTIASGDGGTGAAHPAGGCGCRVPSPGSHGALGPLGLALVALLLRRRSAHAASSQRS